MALTKEAIIEIQEAAKWNFHKQVRLQEEAKQQKEAIEKAIEAARATKTVKPVAEVDEVAPKKGK